MVTPWWTWAGWIGLALIAGSGLSGWWRYHLKRKAAWSDLIRTREYYRQLLTVSPDAVVVGAGGRFRFANDEAVRQLGAERVEQVIGKSYEEFLSQQQFGVLANQIQALRAEPDRNQSFELVVRGFDGTERLFQINARPFMHEEEMFVVAVARDITQRNEAEKRLQFLASMLEHSADPLAAIDPAGKVLFVNDAARRLFKIDDQKLDSMSANDFFPERDLDKVSQLVARVLRGEDVLIEAQLRRVQFDDEIPVQLHCFPIRAAGSDEVIAVAGIARDLTESQRTQGMLRERVEFQELVNGISTLLVNAGSDEVDDVVREALRRIAAYADADRAYIGLVNPDSDGLEVVHQWVSPKVGPLPPIPRRLAEIPLLGSVLRRFETVHVHDMLQLGEEAAAEKAIFAARRLRSLLLVPLVSRRRLGAVIGLSSFGEPRNWSPAVSALLQIVGELIASTLARSDAEAEVRGYSEALEALVRARAARIQQLERQRLEGEKLAATGRMSARIAHEINNPLAGIKNSFRLIRDAIPPAHPHQPYVDRIDREIDRIASIVRQMYDIYRPERERPHEFVLAGSIKEVISLLEPNWAKSRVSVVFNSDPPDLRVVLPETSLRQVLFNLIANAIEASPPDGTIEVIVSARDGLVRVEVADQGGGIPEWAAEQIFEPFFTTKHTSDGSGLGLGLSVSRGLVEAMGGSIGFVCVPARGTTFRVTLPIVGSRAEVTDE
ncbi:MAG: PAS domain S-box protein [Acidobacteriota bacterium]